MSKIQDYAAIGDGRSVALISRHGSLDWLCWPRFDSPSLFAGLLDAQVGGAWSISPTETAQVERHYLDDTNVLQTCFHTATGSLVLTDFMPAASEEESGGCSGRNKSWCGGSSVSEARSRCRFALIPARTTVVFG